METYLKEQVKLLRMICGLLVAIVLVLGITSVLALTKIERITKVTENLNAKVDRAYEAAAPVGIAAVKKGADAISNMDAKELGDKATGGVKEIGGAAKEKAIQWLKGTNPKKADKE